MNSIHGSALNSGSWQAPHHSMGEYLGQGRITALARHQCTDAFPSFSADELGNVYRNAELVKPRNCQGYLATSLGRKTIYLQWIVADAFLGPRPIGPAGEVVRHLDGIRINNRVTNLAYGSFQENAQDRIRHGNSGSKLTVSKVREIHQMVAAGMTERAIASLFDVSHVTIHNIKKRKVWSHVSKAQVECDQSES